MPLAFPGLLIVGAVFFVGIFLLMLSQASSSTMRPAAESSTLSRLLDGPQRLFVQVWHRFVRTTVSRFAASHLIPLVRWFSSLNALVTLWSQTVADDQETVADAMERLTRHTIPRELHTAVRPVAKQASAASQTAHGAVTLARAEQRALGNYRATTNKRLAAQSQAIDVTLPRDIGRVRAREQELARDQAKLRDRTKGLENGAVKTFEWIRAHPLSGVTGVFAGAVAVALAHLGYGFLRCRSWRGLGKRLTCGMGAWLHGLLDLIGVFALTLLGVLNPEALAHVSVRAVDAIEPELKRIIAAAPSENELEKELGRFLGFLGLG